MSELMVLKFGGTSVGSADAMHEVIDIIEKNDFPQVIVLSAMSGTTNDLVQINDALSKGQRDAAVQIIDTLERRYVRVLTDLYPDKVDRDEGRALLRVGFDFLRQQCTVSIEEIDRKEILAQGELFSTRLFTLICRVRGVAVRLIPALNFMKINETGDPDMDLIRDAWPTYAANIDEDCQILITQGYICRNVLGHVDNLKRGGSDYTATIIGAVSGAKEVQIWTDIDGVHNNDPRLVEHTEPIPYLSYREAAELAFFGAKILHPTCVLPVEEALVPLRLKYTMDPTALGTLISTRSSGRPITAIAAKDGLTCIQVYSDRMLQAYGFLTRLFRIFEKYKTSVDMITTSEVSVSLTINDDTHLADIKKELACFAEVEIASDYTIICVVGNQLDEDHPHIQRVLSAIEDLPVRMVSAGGSRHNVSILIKSEYKTKALQKLNGLFE